MKNWDVTIAQLILLIIGGYYMYSALTILFARTTTLAAQSTRPKAFVFTITIGVVLLGLALGLQQIRIYRRRKAKEVRVF